MWSHLHVVCSFILNDRTGCPSWRSCWPNHKGHWIAVRPLRCESQYLSDTAWKHDRPGASLLHPPWLTFTIASKPAVSHLLILTSASVTGEVLLTADWPMIHPCSVYRDGTCARPEPSLSDLGLVSAAQLWPNISNKVRTERKQTNQVNKDPDIVLFCWISCSNFNIFIHNTYQYKYIYIHGHIGKKRSKKYL